MSRLKAIFLIILVMTISYGVLQDIAAVSPASKPMVLLLSFCFAVFIFPPSPKKTYKSKKVDIFHHFLRARINSVKAEA